MSGDGVAVKFEIVGSCVIGIAWYFGVLFPMIEVSEKLGLNKWVRARTL